MTKREALSEHWDKYAKLREEKTRKQYTMPVDDIRIKEALERGDIHLNSIPLFKWDTTTSHVGYTRKDGKGSYSSIAEQVNFLKNYAIAVVAGYSKEQYLDLCTNDKAIH